MNDAVCFHCQQAAEKYLKALLQELGLVIPKTHDLDDLLQRVLPHHPKLSSLHRFIDRLSQYAVDYRYPGFSATSRQTRAAMRWMQLARKQIRAELGLRTREAPSKLGR